MMNQYESMLNLTFEIEGLISLLQKRDDEAVKEVKSLLDSKVKALYNGIIGYSPSEAGEEILPEDYVEEEQVEVAEVAVEIPVTEYYPEETTEFVTESETIIEVAPEIVPENEPVDESESKSETAPISTQAPISEPVKTKLPVFTINDKFRFRRELFSNSEADFVETLNVLGAMSSFEEAEDYLYNDLCWDSSSDEVAEFMTIIKDYFDKR